MTLSPQWKEDEDEAIDISKEIEEPNWKVVGSPSRRESFSVRVLDGSNNSPPNTSQQISQPQTQQQQQDYRRGSISSTEKQWGSFGGFQWNGPSIFEEEINSVPKTPLPPNTPDSLYDPTAILSVPMLPNVSLEPSYRPQRSFSFSMGQDPTFFGYDDYGNGDMYARSALAPTLEEDEEQHDNFSSFDDAYLRARSQSSNAAFGVQPASSYWNNDSIRSSHLLNSNNNRRSSLGFVPFIPSNTTTTNIQQHNSKDILPQRRMSQPLISDYSFPNGGPTKSNLNHSSPFLVGVPTTISLQQQQNQLSERLENIHIHKSTSSSLINNSHPQPLLLPENITTSLSTPQHQQTPAAATTTTNTNIGKGMLLQRLPPHIPLYMVEFKSGRTDFYYVSDPLLRLHVGDLVIVEADRGKDLGKVATDILTVDQVSLLQQQQQQNMKSSISNNITDDDNDDSKKSSSDSHVKKIYRQAGADEVNMLIMKDQDEQRALSVCLQKIKNRKLPMEVVDAEFQWDRRKLTFYFIAERRIDFRELVRELFKIYKTRIWMCAVNPSTPGKIISSC